MSGRQRDAKSPLIIRGEGCDFRSLVVLDDEGGIRERFRAGSVRSDWSRLSWAKRDHSFDPRSRSGLCLPGRKTCRHDQEHQNDWEFSECHYLITLIGLYSGQNDGVNFRGAHAAGVLRLAAGQMGFVKRRANVTFWVEPATVIQRFSASGRKQHAGARALPGMDIRLPSFD